MWIFNSTQKKEKKKQQTTCALKIKVQFAVLIAMV